MNCEIIDKALKELKVNSSYAIIGKNKVIDKIHSEHLKSVDSKLTDIRILSAKLENDVEMTKKDAFKILDDFIYKMQVS